MWTLSGPRYVGTPSAIWPQKKHSNLRFCELHELIPSATATTVFVNPTNPNAKTQSGALRAAGSHYPTADETLNVTTESEIDAAFAHLAEQRPARFSLMLMHSWSADEPNFSVWQNAMLFPPFSIGGSTPEAGGRGGFAAEGPILTCLSETNSFVIGH